MVKNRQNKIGSDNSFINPCIGQRFYGLRRHCQTEKGFVSHLKLIPCSMPSRMLGFVLVTSVHKGVLIMYIVPQIHKISSMSPSLVTILHFYESYRFNIHALDKSFSYILRNLIPGENFVSLYTPTCTCWR